MSSLQKPAKNIEPTIRCSEAKQGQTVTTCILTSELEFAWKLMGRTLHRWWWWWWQWCGCLTEQLQQMQCNARHGRWQVFMDAQSPVLALSTRVILPHTLQDGKERSLMVTRDNARPSGFSVNFCCVISVHGHQSVR